MAKTKKTAAVSSEAEKTSSRNKTKFHGFFPARGGKFCHSLNLMSMEEYHQFCSSVGVPKFHQGYPNKISLSIKDILEALAKERLLFTSKYFFEFLHHLIVENQDSMKPLHCHIWPNQQTTYNAEFLMAFIFKRMGANMSAYVKSKWIHEITKTMSNVSKSSSIYDGLKIMQEEYDIPAPESFEVSVDLSTFVIPSFESRVAVENVESSDAESVSASTHRSQSFLRNRSSIEDNVQKKTPNLKRKAASKEKKKEKESGNNPQESASAKISKKSILNASASSKKLAEKTRVSESQNSQESSAEDSDDSTFEDSALDSPVAALCSVENSESSMTNKDSKQFKLAKKEQIEDASVIADNNVEFENFNFQSRVSSLDQSNSPEDYDFVENTFDCQSRISFSSDDVKPFPIPPPPTMLLTLPEDEPTPIPESPLNQNAFQQFEYTCPSEKQMKSICEKFGLNYDRQKYSLLCSKIIFDQINANSVPVDVIRTTETSGFESLSVLFTGDEYFAEKIREGTRMKFIKDSAATKQWDAEKLVEICGTILNDSHLQTIANWCSCKFMVWFNDKWNLFGNWESGDDSVFVLKKEILEGEIVYKIVKALEDY